MINIADLLKSKQLENKGIEKSERSQIIKEMYEIYTHPGERVLRRKENWKRYCAWCRENKVSDSKTNQAKFKKEKRFIKEQSIKTFVFFLHHIKTQDLYYVKSRMVDCRNRGQSASAWLLSNTKVK